MKVFLDASVLLAAAGSRKGASRALFELSSANGWQLMSSPWVIGETRHNLGKLPEGSADAWLQLQKQLTVVADVVSLDRPVVFAASKDRPVLFTALAAADLLITLDKADFGDLLGGAFYGLPVLLPYDFLMAERAAGRLV